MKSCQKRHINKTLNILHYLEHAYKYEGQEWIPSQIIAEKCSKQSAGFTRSAVGGMLKRWREAGIIESQLQPGSPNSYHYRFNPQGLKGMRVSEFIYKWNTMSYAEKIAFTSK
ncbi:MAG TPA: hypothetical protein EYQ84_09680 [Nitrospinaceae bacterium]|nr:hypothetical protein [Nitrospinaceae bacterium]